MEGGGNGAIAAAAATTVTNHHSPPPPPPSSQTVSSNLGSESERKAKGYFSKNIFGHAPSQTEVQNAISDLRRAFCGKQGIGEGDGESMVKNEDGGVMDGKMLEQFTYDSRTLMRSLGEKRLLDAYHLLQTDASVQRLVGSISSDAEVWDAICKNDAVQDLQGFLPQTGTREKATSYDQELDSTTVIFKWIFAFMRLKFMELIEKLEVFIIGALKSTLKNGKNTSKLDDVMEEKVRSSLFLSVVVLVVVVVTRIMET
ncbi:hypothetical protein OSB04_011151 [Centaurea solstitialis]|uniref:Uncharacterized protein n=1 Tax=Centaurea solstitialis TaxID=347529 RepID=A0AA38WCN1_9ASTR|nr:hypothetical protein OSB04_011151 [Centaurea solstitialis]